MNGINCLLSIILPILFVGFTYSCVGSYNCPYSCPSGKKAGSNSNYTATINGCKQFVASFNATLYPDFEQCCNQLESCYANCTTEKYLCDKQIHSCVESICHNSTHSLVGVFNRAKCEALEKSVENVISGKQHCNLVTAIRVKACCV